MSRSFKHTPVIKIGCPKAKRSAKRRVRRYRGTIPNGSFYKKLYPQYDICDHWWLEPKAQKDVREFKRLYNKLYLNFCNTTLTIEEAQEILSDMYDMKYHFRYVYK